MYRHCYGNEEENAILAQIRDEELKNPAPFSNREIVDFGMPKSESLYPLDEQGGEFSDSVEDVPIIDIVGLSNTNNLDNYEEGMTFRDVLFKCLHGASLTKESLQYFVGDDLKSDKHECNPEFTYFPQDEKYMGSKGYARRGVGLTKRGDVFYVDQGKQRTIIAMFHIYQVFGSGGLFRRVRVERYG